MPWNSRQKIMQLQIDPDLHERIKRFAELDDRSVAAEVRVMLQREVEMRESAEATKGEAV